MKHIVHLIFVGLLLTGCSAGPGESGTRTSTPAVERRASRNRTETLKLAGVVLGVADGDTITLLDHENVKKRIRLQGIDAPEKGQPYTNVSRRNLETLVGQKQVTIEYQKLDRYNRIVAKVYVDNQNAGSKHDAGLKLDAGLEQIRAGLAWHYKYFGFGSSAACHWFVAPQSGTIESCKASPSCSLLDLSLSLFPLHAPSCAFVDQFFFVPPSLRASVLCGELPLKCFAPQSH